MKFLLQALLVTLVLTSRLSAQEVGSIELKGRLLEKGSNAPIGNAACLIKNFNHLGAFSADDGTFSLNVPKELVNDTLIIRHLGFGTVSLPVRYGIDGEFGSIFMEAEPMQLQEIVIRDPGERLKALFVGAVSSIPDNFPRQPHSLTGLYRKVSTEGRLYTQLVEAAVTVQDHSYKTDTDRIIIQESLRRETVDHGDVDSLIVSALLAGASDAVARQWSVPLNPIYRLYESNYIRTFRRASNMFNISNLKRYVDDHYRFKLMNVSIEGVDSVYQVAFSEGVVPREPTGENYFKINSSDLAITEFQLTHGWHGRLNHQVQVRFRKYGDSYYPYFIKTVQPRYINRNEDDQEFDIETLWFEPPQTDNYDRIKKRQALDRFNPSRTDKGLYDSAFWRTFDLLKEHPLPPETIKSLERFGTLDQQFGTH